MKVKNTDKLLQRHGAYFGTLPMPGMPTDGTDAVPGHAGIIQAFAQHGLRQQGGVQPADKAHHAMPSTLTLPTNEGAEGTCCLPRALQSDKGTAVSTLQEQAE